MQAQAVRSEQTQVCLSLCCDLFYAKSSSETCLQDTLTAAQSLQSIQTLLRAGLGCITYLRYAHPAKTLSLRSTCPVRNLLPADNFSESKALYPESSGIHLTNVATHLGYLTSAASDPQPSDSFSSESGSRNVSGFKIMTVTRGFTEEADKLLDYLVRDNRTHICAYMRQIEHYVHGLSGKWHI